MASHIPENVKRRRRPMPWSRRRLTLLLVLAAAMTLPVLLAGVYRHKANQRLEAKFEAIRAAGYPATKEDLEAWYPAPVEEENAGPVVEQAMKAFKGRVGEYDYQDISEAMDEAPKGGRLPEEVLAMMRAYLVENGEALRLFHELAQHPERRFPVDLSKGFEMELPHLAQLRQGVRLLGLEALVAAHDGNTQLAFEALLDSLSVAETLGEEPILISQLVRVACNGSSTSNLGRVLQVTDFSPEQLTLLQHALARAEEPEALSRALATERAVGTTAYVDPGGYIDMVGGVAAWDNFVPGATRVLAQAGGAIGWFDSEREEYLDHMGEMIEANRLPYHEALDVMARLEQELEDPGFIPRMSDGLLPGLTRATQSMARDAGNLRTAATAIAVERYENSYGKPPDRLEDLVPAFLDAVPLDPYDGKPLRYRAEENGYLLYSVGENRQDDGGVQTENRQWGTEDWVFQVLRGIE